MQYSIILISKRFFSVLRKALKSYTIFERPIRYGSVNLAKPEDFRMALPYLQIEGQSLKISVWLGRTCDRGHSSDAVWRGGKGHSWTKFSPEPASIIQYDKFSCKFRILRPTIRRCMVQTVNFLVDTKGLNLMDRRVATKFSNHKGLGPLFTFLKNAAPKTNVRIYGMNTPTFEPIITVSSIYGLVLFPRGLLCPARVGSA